MSEIEELKPCPFCGGEANFRRVVEDEETSEYLPWWWVACRVCLSSTGECFNKEEAVTAWNRRTLEEKTGYGKETP